MAQCTDLCMQQYEPCREQYGACTNLCMDLCRELYGTMCRAHMQLYGCMDHAMRHMDHTWSYTWTMYQCNTVSHEVNFNVTKIYCSLKKIIKMFIRHFHQFRWFPCDIKIDLIMCEPYCVKFLGVFKCKFKPPYSIMHENFLLAI